MTMTAASEKPNDDYRIHWQRHKKLRTYYYCAVFGGFALVGLVAVPSLVTSSNGNFDFIPVIVCVAVWVLASLIATGAVAQFRCPRCGREFSEPWRFFMRGLGYDTYLIAKRCVHCGLPRFAVSGVEIIPSLFCSKCGAALGQAARFCAKCGAPAEPVSIGLRNPPPL